MDPILRDRRTASSSRSAAPRGGRLVGLGLGAVLLAVIVPAAGAAQVRETGELAVHVVDREGLPLAGVEVRLRGPAPELTSRDSAAGADGLCLFAALPPGRYEALVWGAGLEARTIADVVVRAGDRTEIEVPLQLQVTEDVSVAADTEPAPELVERESTSGLSVVTRETLTSLPLPADQVIDALPLLPGVVRGNDNLISIGGTLPSDSILLLNGADLTDPFSGRYRLRLPLEAVERVDVHTGVYPANYGQLIGGVVDVTTAPGGERWSFEFNNFIPRPRIEGGTLHGFEAFSPRARLSGPLVPGRLYISQAGEYYFNHIDVNDVPRNDNQDDDLRSGGWESLTQLDWLVNERHRIGVSTLLFPRRVDAVGLDGLTPRSATVDLDREVGALMVSHGWLVDDKSFLNTVVQGNWLRQRIIAHGDGPLVVLPEGLAGNASHTEDRDTTHWQLQSTYTRQFDGGPGNHVVDFGADVQGTSVSGVYANGSILVQGADRRVLQRIEFSPESTLEGSKLDWAGFVQDKWRVNDRLALDLGLRGSRDGAARRIRLAPRVGVAWDPLGEGRTLLKASGGLLYRRIFLGEALWEQLPDRFETDLDAATGEGVTHAFAPRLTDRLEAPRSLLLSGEIDHRINADLTLRARYSQRQSHDQLVVSRIEGDGFVVPAGAPALSGTLLPDGFGSMLLANTGRTTYREAEVTAGYRLRPGSELFFSYVRSQVVGDLNDFNSVAGERPDPVFRPNRQAHLSFDAPHRLLVWGTLELPGDLRVAPVLEWHSGFPFSTYQEDQAYAGAPNAQRLPAFFAFDAQATKGLEILGYDVRLGVNMFNVGGHFNPRQIISNLASPSFGELRNSVPMIIRAKITVQF